MSSDGLTVRLIGAIDFLSVDSLVLVLDNIAEILRDVESAVSESRPVIDWHIAAISFSSPLAVTLSPTADPQGYARETITASIAGLRQIERSSETRPMYFSINALERAKKLVSVLNRDVARLIVVPSEGDAVTVSQRVAANVDALLPPPHEELGSVEGTLETLSIHEGNLFAIWDSVTGKRVECHISPEMLTEAHAAFGKRVSVSGRIRYSGLGRPASIRVEEIYVFPSRSELPQFADLVSS
jgi:hypothetical protein